MNILYLCADPGIPVRGTKGAAVHVRAMIHAFVELGHQVTLITPRVGSEDAVLSAKLVEVTPEFSTTDREARAREIARAVHQVGSLELGREKYDFIYERYSLWSDAGAQLARVSGLPLILEVNAPLRLEAARYRNLERDDLAADIERRAFTAATTIAVVSKPLRDYAIEHGADAARVQLLPNAVDEKIFHPGVDRGAIREKLGLAEKFVVGFVGTVKPWHDLETLIHAFAQVRDSINRTYHLLLVGDIPDSLREKIACGGLAEHTTIVGPIPHEQVPAHLAAMDVAVSPHPSLTGFYFSPLKLFEYLACGVATLAADVAPVRQVVAHGETGLLYPPGDASALGHCIVRLADDAELRARIAWAGAAYVLGRHTWKRNAAHVIARVCGEAITWDEPMLPLFDAKLGAYLYRATRADLAIPLLKMHLARNNLESAQIRILKYKPHRRGVIAYAQADGAKAKFFAIGKVFKDDRGIEHLAIQRELWQNGLGKESVDGITIAEPLAYIPELRMLLQEHVPGQTLEECNDPAVFSNRVEQSARAIAKLHSSQVALTKTYMLADEVANLNRWGEEITVACPDRSKWIACQLDALQTMASRLPCPNLAPVHRDFYYSQLLFTDHRVTLIDLDLLALADPALDVGNFSAHLGFLSLQKFSDAHRLDADMARFLATYARECTPATPDDFSTRFKFYHAATYFRLLYVVLDRPNWAHWFDALAELTEESITSE